ncbi:cation transporter [Calothrix sp. PCC 7507]|uniref:cation transporter n=1 Tax=Calothrix sp. PCC 7507 TaxID=99598 RepID=UPI00029EE541|nr:cation transporter [Calothrix sp. PCC 7507]AFY31565.1 hypothetical protein Cal7507_1089 [Calothrix sp. PCC 7507]
MALKLKILNMSDRGSAATISESIYVMALDAKVEVDVKHQTITVESTASEESIKQVIVAAGYTIEGY